MGEQKKGTPWAGLQMLKERGSGKLRTNSYPTPKTQLSFTFPKFIADLRQFWQPRFYDFNVYSHKKKKEKLEYMHANPVVRGLVKHAKDWPWSSFSFYGRDEAGLVDSDPVNLYRHGINISRRKNP